MKKTLLSILLLKLAFFTEAQHTFVPDDNFEQALIDLGFDDVLDDFVLTANIYSITDLDVTWKNISDLTGIEDFHSLNYLNVGFNHLTNLDLSQNTEMEFLFCEMNNLVNLNLTQNTNLNTLYGRGNHLTTIDLTQNHELESLEIQSNHLIEINLSVNPLLRHLNISSNKLHNLNLSNNPKLREVFCYENQLSSLDLSHNPIIYNLNCGNNQFTNLDLTQNTHLNFITIQGNPELKNFNVQNGNNTDILIFLLTDNPKLNCIQVDDPIWLEEHWTNVDPWVSFSGKCILSNVETEFKKFKIYPNPTEGIVFFSEEIQEISIYDLTGKKISSPQLTTNQFDLSFLKTGNYILKGTTRRGIKFSEKILKN